MIFFAFKDNLISLKNEVETAKLKMVKKMMKSSLCGLLMVCFLLAGHARAGDRDFLGVGAGVLGIVDSEHVAFTCIEYRSRFEFYKMNPCIGIEFSDWFFYYATGILMNFSLMDKWRLTPSFGMGHYPENGDVDLGGEFQFVSAFELSYEFNNSGRLGIGWSHISNGGIYGINPGTEILKITYYVPLGQN